MKTTVQALKELYATLGGDLADVALIDRVPDMIEALNSIAVAVPAPTAEDEGKVITVGEDGALGFADALPPVTAEDAGKVLAVDEQGAWNPAEASGGGNFVRKTLKEVSVKFPNAGWNVIVDNFKIYKPQIPEDYICFAGVRCTTSNDVPYSIVMRSTGYDMDGNISIGYHISVYREEASSTFGNTFVFEYFAKA